MSGPVDTFQSEKQRPRTGEDLSALPYTVLKERCRERGLATLRGPLHCTAQASGHCQPPLAPMPDTPALIHTDTH